MPAVPLDSIDYEVAGLGPEVVLVHSSVSGARQWRKLQDHLAPAFTAKAINLFGYGKTRAWPADRQQTLDDHAGLICAIAEPAPAPISLVGHSFGGSVAMKAVLKLGARVEKLVLYEPNSFFLLRDNDRHDAFQEAWGLRDKILVHGLEGNWARAAELFADYWGGAGTWAATNSERRAVFIESLKPVQYEWDAIMGETVTLTTLAASMPEKTLVLYDPDTLRPIREIIALLKAHTPWQFKALQSAGHMAPLTKPDLVNPIIENFLAS